MFLEFSLLVRSNISISYSVKKSSSSERQSAGDESSMGFATNSIDNVCALQWELWKGIDSVPGFVAKRP